MEGSKIWKGREKWKRILQGGEVEEGFSGGGRERIRGWRKVRESLLK